MNFTQEGNTNNGGGSPVDEDDDVKKEMSEGGSPGSNGDAPKKAGRRKINIEFIEDKSRRHITFSKRKAGIMKKAYELSTLTGTQVLLLVASETGHVYTFATPKLQPLITKPEGKNLIQSCLNAAEAAPASSPTHHPATGRISAASYNEPSMMYPASESMYSAEHPAPTVSNYDKDDKDHRIPTRNTNNSNSNNNNQPDSKSGYHMDIAQLGGGNHMGLAYGAPFQAQSSGSLNLMGSNPLSGMGMSAYPPSMAHPTRYMSAAPSAHTPPKR